MKRSQDGSRTRSRQPAFRPNWRAVVRILFEADESPALREWASAALRATFGLMVVFLYGVKNVSDVAYHLHNGASSKLLDEITALGVPAPTLFAAFAAGGLLSGGLFVGAGLFTRAAAGVLTIVLFGAIAENLSSGRDPQLAVLYTLISLRFTLSGG